MKAAKPTSRKTCNICIFILAPTTPGNEYAWPARPSPSILQANRRCFTTRSLAADEMYVCSSLYPSSHIHTYDTTTPAVGQLTLVNIKRTPDAWPGVWFFLCVVDVSCPTQCCMLSIRIGNSKISRLAGVKFFEQFKELNSIWIWASSADQNPELLAVIAWCMCYRFVNWGKI